MSIQKNPVGFKLRIYLLSPSIIFGWRWTWGLVASCLCRVSVTWAGVWFNPTPVVHNKALETLLNLICIRSSRIHRNTVPIWLWPKIILKDFYSIRACTRARGSTWLVVAVVVVLTLGCRSRRRSALVPILIVSTARPWSWARSRWSWSPVSRGGGGVGISACRFWGWRSWGLSVASGTLLFLWLGLGLGCWEGEEVWEGEEMWLRLMVENRVGVESLD